MPKSNVQEAPRDVAAAFDRFPALARDRLLAVRELIFRAAAETEGVGTLTETLKWGEPAYLTLASGSGSTIRLGAPKAEADRVAIYFNCRTSLVAEFRERFSDRFAFEGDRALLLEVDRPLEQEPLSFCLAAALTYHRRRR